jgi:hypothetical protein
VFHHGVIQHGVSILMQPQAQCVLLLRLDIRVGRINDKKTTNHDAWVREKLFKECMPPSKTVA